MNRRLLALIAALAAVVALIVWPARRHTPAAEPGTATATAAAATAAPGTTGSAPARTDAPDAPDAPGNDSIYPLGAPPPTLPGDPGAAAAAFAAAWTRHTGTDAATWTDRLTALATPVLAGKLPGVDPRTVPADTVTGPPQITPAAGGADAAIPTDAGTLQLTLRYLDPPGQWRVDTLGWTPAR